VRPGLIGPLTLIPRTTGHGYNMTLIPEESVRELIALTGLPLAQQDVPSTLQQMCRIAVRALPPARGATFTSFTESGPGAVAASDEWAKSLDEMQYHEHEGPCIDAARTGLVFRVRDLATDSRWPSYAPRAAEHGARAMVSLPLTVEGKVLGALNVYSHEPDAFSPEEVSIAEVIAAHASLAMHTATALKEHRSLSEGLREAMQSRAVIEQAKGILMAQRKVTAEAAFDLLREASQHRNTKLRLVAEQVVETGELQER
jgi:GAF domain-containing protein